MDRLNDIIKLTGNKDLDNLLLILVAIRLRESSAEAGTYHFLISETEAFNCLCKTFKVDKGSKEVLASDFKWENILNSVYGCTNKSKKDIVIINLDGELTVFKLDTIKNIQVVVYVIVALLLENEAFIRGLVKDYKKVQGYRLKAKSTRSVDNVLEVEYLLCKSFDDFKPLYVYREVIYEANRFYISIKGDVVYK